MKKSATKALEKELAEKFTKKGTVCLLNIALFFFFFCFCSESMIGRMHQYDVVCQV